MSYARPKQKHPKVITVRDRRAFRSVGKKIPCGHGIPGVKVDKSKGGSFRVASGEVLPNLVFAKLEGVGTLSGNPMKTGTQVAEISKPLLASVGTAQEELRKGWVLRQGGKSGTWSSVLK